MINGTHPNPNPGLAARFDWYSATIADSPHSVEETLAVGLGCVSVASTPMHGYKHGRELRDATGEIKARVLFGGNAEGSTHAFATGADTDAFQAVVRSVWPDQHYVSRFDSAIDYRGRGSEPWDAIYAAALDLANDKGLRLNTMGDWITPDAERVHGRTLYVGSNTSDVQVRLYEKGLQQLEHARDPDLIASIPRDWVRLEVRVRPSRQARDRAARIEPIEGFGFARWTRDLLQRVEGLDVEPTAMQFERETDDERAITWMVQQYGKALARRAAAAGGWAALGLDLELLARDLGLNTAPPL